MYSGTGKCNSLGKTDVKQGETINVNDNAFSKYKSNESLTVRVQKSVRSFAMRKSFNRFLKVNIEHSVRGLGKEDILGMNMYTCPRVI